MIHLIYHNDPDGYLSGYIASQYFKQKTDKIKYYSIDHGNNFPLFISEIDEHLSNKQRIGRKDVVCLMDFSLKPDVMQSLFREIGLQQANLIWIDHHKTVLEQDYGNFNCFVDSIKNKMGKDEPVLNGILQVGKGACELTWEYFNGDKVKPKVVSLVSQFDTWQEKGMFDWEEVVMPTMAFISGMNANPKHKDADTIWQELFDNHKKYIKLGKTLQQYRDNLNAQNMHSYAVEKIIYHDDERYRAITINSCDRGSRAFQSVYDPAKHDLMLVYVCLKNGMFSVSLYSDKIDVSRIAKKYNGGGHTGAAGFITTWSALMNFLERT